MYLCGASNDDVDGDDMDVTLLEPLLPASPHKKPKLSYWDMYHALSSDEYMFFPMELCSCVRIVTIINFILFIFVAVSKPFVWESRTNGLFEILLVLLIIFSFTPALIHVRMRTFQQLGAIGLLKKEHHWVALLNGTQSSFAANSLLRIAKVYELLNQLEEALTTLQAISTFPCVANRGRGGIMLHRAMGRILMKLGRFPEALEALQAALQLTKLQPAHAILIQADLNAIAVVHEKMGNLSEAIARRQEAWQVLEDIGHTQVVTAAVCLTRMASTYEIMDQQDAALEKLELALTIYIVSEGEFPRSSIVARLHNRIGNLQAAMGASGAEHFRQAIEVYRRGGMSDEQTALASLLRKVGADDNV